MVRCRVFIGLVLGGVLTEYLSWRLVIAGMLLAAGSLVWLTRIGVHSGYASAVLPPLMVTGLGFGFTIAPSMNTGTFGVAPQDAGVASATLNTGQQIGGSIGTSLLNTIFASAVAHYLTSHLSPATLVHGHPAPSLIGMSLIHGYTTGFWVGAGIFGAGAVICGTLFRSGPLHLSAPPAADPAGTAVPQASGHWSCTSDPWSVALTMVYADACRLAGTFRRRHGRSPGPGPPAPAAQPEQAENGKDERDEAVAAAVARPHRGVGEGGRVGEAPGADRQHAGEFDRAGQDGDPACGRTADGEGDRSDDVDHCGEGRQQVGDRGVAELRRDLHRGPRGSGERKQRVDGDQHPARAGLGRTRRRCRGPRRCYGFRHG